MKKLTTKQKTERIALLTSFLNTVGKSNYVDTRPVVHELITLHDLDPAEILGGSYQLKLS